MRAVHPYLNFEGNAEVAELYGSFADRFGVRWMVNYPGDVELPLPPRTEP